MSHERDGLARRRNEVDVVEHEPRWIVAERDAAELNAKAEGVTRPSLKPRILQIRSVRRIFPIGLGIDQPKYALGAGHRHERLVVLVADDRDRRKEEVREEEKLNQCIELHLMLEHPPAAEQEQD